ncbi:MAG: hypothetical protein ABIP56_03800 [Dokdonella sp.]
MKRIALFTALLAAGICSADAQSQVGADLTLASIVPISGMSSRPARAEQIEAVDPTAFYSNVTTSGTSGIPAAGTTMVGASLITTMVCDDLHFSNTQATARITGVRFSVVNFDANTVSARPSIAFFQNNGAGGGPGTAAGGVTFPALTLPTSSAIIVASGTLPNPINVPVVTSNPVLWACQYFDNDGGATGATQAQMDSIGVAFFNPPDLGTSQDLFFGGFGPGSPASNPAGSIGNFGGPPNPASNFGWELLNADGDTIFRNGFDG